MIKVHHLTKEYKVPKKENTKKFSFNRQYETIYGLKDVSFEISEGEYVGLVGLNGAGKTTLIKILSGILTPTDGEVSVMGYCPYLSRKKYTKNIGVVMGQKSVLYYDLPVLESFKFYADVYGIEREAFEKKLDMLDECMQIRSFLHIPVRKLSLGQKMRCEIGVALLHDPKVLFLDEPTLGLDIVAKRGILDFIKLINRKLRTTIILTTHDIEDISSECERLILIGEGRITYDGRTSEICGRSRYKLVSIEYKEDFICDPVKHLICEVKKEKGRDVWKVKSEDLEKIMKYVLEQWDKILDININTESLTETLYEFFRLEGGIS